jgi:hypothetical protein
MPLILAIEPDRRQANQLRSMVRTRLEAELVLADSAERALAALGDRVPDLILTSALLSPKDEIALDKRLRSLDGSASHVQTLTIPMLASPEQAKSSGMLSALRGGRARTAHSEGCDPAVFAEQCAGYLERARAERVRQASAAEQQDATAPPLSKDQPGRDPTGQAESIKSAASFDPAAWADPASDITPAIPMSDVARVPDADLDRAGQGVVSRENPPTVDTISTSATWPAVTPQWPPPTSPNANRPELADRRGKEGMGHALDGYDDADTYEIDLGELTDIAANPDPVWRADNTEASDAKNVQSYEIDVDELFADTDRTPKQRAHSEAGGNGAGIHSQREAGRRFGVSQPWPTPEVDLPDSEQVVFLDDLPPKVQSQVAPSSEAAAKQEAPSSDSPESSRPEWLDMVESLQSDVQLLQTDWAPTTFPSPPTVSANADVADHVTQLREASIARPAAPDKSRAKAKKREPKKKRPVKDEWGFFDPEQCGFAALLTKLEEITDDEFTDFDS